MAPCPPGKEQPQVPTGRRVSIGAGKRPGAAPRGGAVRRVERPQGGSRAHPDRRRGTDGRAGCRRPTAARSRRAAPQNGGGTPRPRAARRTAGAGRTRRESRGGEAGGRAAPEGRPRAPPGPGSLGCGLALRLSSAPPARDPAAPALARAAGVGGPGSGARRPRAQEVGRGPACARAAEPPDSAALSDFGVSLPGGERVTSSFP